MGICTRGYLHTGKVVVDLRWLRSAEDMGVRALADAVASAGGRGTDIAVVEGPDAVRQIIDRITPVDPCTSPSPENEGAAVTSDATEPPCPVRLIVTFALGGLDWALGQLVGGRVRRRRGAPGPAPDTVPRKDEYFAGVWGSGLVMLPALGVAPPPQEWGEKAVAMDAAHHAVYAGAADLAFRFLEREG